MRGQTIGVAVTALFLLVPAAPATTFRVPSPVSNCGAYSLFDCFYESCQPVLRCCDIYSTAGGEWRECIASQIGANGNFSADPLFCDPPADDLTLEAHSPCLPGQHPEGWDCGLIGAWGHGCGQPSRTESSTWGVLKSLFETPGR